MQEKTTIFYLLPLFWNNYTKKEASCWKPLIVGAEGFEPPTLCL